MNFIIIAKKVYDILYAECIKFVEGAVRYAVLYFNDFCI